MERRPVFTHRSRILVCSHAKGVRGSQHLTCDSARVCDSAVEVIAIAIGKYLAVGDIYGAIVTAGVDVVAGVGVAEGDVAAVIRNAVVFVGIAGGGVELAASDGSVIASDGSGVADSDTECTTVKSEATSGEDTVCRRTGGGDGDVATVLGVVIVEVDGIFVCARRMYIKVSGGGIVEALAIDGES